MAESKVTIVVSPLIALIKDQIEHLQKLKIVAESINSKMGEKDRRRVLDDLNCKVRTYFGFLPCYISGSSGAAFNDINQTYFFPC